SWIRNCRCAAHDRGQVRCGATEASVRHHQPTAGTQTTHRSLAECLPRHVTTLPCRDRATAGRGRERIAVAASKPRQPVPRTCHRPRRGCDAAAGRDDPPAHARPSWCAREFELAPVVTSESEDPETRHYR